MVVFGPTLSWIMAYVPAGSRTLLHGSLVQGCPSDRVYDPRVVETGIEESSLLSALPGHLLSAAHTACSTDTVHVLGTKKMSDTCEANGACPSPPFDTHSTSKP